jgi:hypothetical protein
LYPPEIGQAPHLSPHIVDFQAVPSHFSLTGQRINPRQVSVGAVWNVGGASVATRGPWLGKLDGQKGYTRSKSTAPMYFARYEPIQDISSSEELDMSKTRLATAFDVDLTQRQFNICKSTTQKETRFCRSFPIVDKLHPLAWKDCAWKRAECVPGKQPHEMIGKRALSANNKLAEALLQGNLVTHLLVLTLFRFTFCMLLL